MNLILTSDFPASAPLAVVDRIRASAARPRVAWIPAFTEGAQAAFNAARERLGALGITDVEYLDIDEDLDQVQIAYLHEFDVICLSGADAVRFRYNAIRAGLAGRLRQCAAQGRLILGVSGGAALLTPNVSLFRLHAEPLDSVLATRGRLEALGAVAYEVLPHADRLAPEFLAAVQQYSAQTGADVIALPDGGALFPTSPDAFHHIGAITRYRRGEIIQSDDARHE